MMRAFALLLLAALPVFAAPAPLPPPLPAPGFRSIPDVPVGGLQTYGPGIPVAEFLRITLGDMARKPYVLMPDAAGATQHIAVDLSRWRRDKTADPLPLVREVMSGLGYSLRDVGGVLFVERRKEGTPAESAQPDTLYVYQPRHRTIGSLASYLGLWPALTFSYASGISVRAPSGSGGARDGPAGQSSPGGVVGGATTYSQDNRDPSVLVVKGPALAVDAFKAFISQVDTPVPEVVLRAYVFEVRDTENKDSSTQLVLSILGGHLGATLGPAPSAAGDAVRLNLPNLSLAVGSLTGDSRVRLVSSPVLRAEDGSTATVTIGTDTPTLGAVVSQNGTTQQSVTYQSAGVLLSVSPRVLQDSIRLSISQELSSFVRTDTGLADTPTKLRRAFRSDVVARDGEVLLLGGLSEVQDTEAERKGFAWFGSKSKAKSSSDIVVLLKVERL
jgi:hypothetical protein